MAFINPTNAFVPETSIGAGLSINVGKGQLWLSGTPVSYTTETNVPLTANTFNYVFLNGGSGAIQVNTSGFSGANIPIATVLTGSKSVLTLTDNRPDFYTLTTGGTGANFANETPGGTINGSNTSFTLVNTPNPAAGLLLFMNGVLQQAGGGDFTLSGSNVTFVVAPSIGAILFAYYRY